MNHANYCLLTIYPNLEKLDLLCVGVVALDGNGEWHISAGGANKKAALFGMKPDVLERSTAYLSQQLEDCSSLDDAQKYMLRGSTMRLDSFQGVFSYANDAEFDKMLNELTSEYVALPSRLSDKQGKPKTIKPRIRAKLRRHFLNMGIMGKEVSDIYDHKVVSNYPVSEKHGLTAEFALKNSVMHFTETVDFDVAEDGIRTKNYEAQAKCLVMRAAIDNYGDSVRHIVISGGDSLHASKNIDLLSSVGNVYSMSHPSDIEKYLQAISVAAKAYPQLNMAQHTL